MKLAKAIELSEEAVRSLKKGNFPDHADAVLLGVKALKHFRHLRDLNIISFVKLLPGETPDA